MAVTRTYRHSLTGELRQYTPAFAALYPALIEVDPRVPEAIPADHAPDTAEGDALPVEPATTKDKDK